MLRALDNEHTFNFNRFFHRVLCLTFRQNPMTFVRIVSVRLQVKRAVGYLVLTAALGNLSAWFTSGEESYWVLTAAKDD